MKFRSRIVLTLLISAAVLGGWLFAWSPASSAAATRLQAASTHRTVRALFDIGVRPFLRPGQSIPATVAQIPHFNSTIVDGANTYAYMMVGKNPAKKVTNALTTIKTYLIPVDITFQGSSLSWDPTVSDSCDASTAALTRVQHSPLFVPQTWTWGGTAIGKGEVTDAFQRANFWSDANPAGINPTYGVNLKITSVLAKVTVSVPAADQGELGPISCGNGEVGEVNNSWFENYVATTLIPALAGEGVSPTTFPIFVLHDVGQYINNSPSQCCVLGYHSAASVTAGIQTYAVADYDNSGIFSEADIAVLTHEVGEWMDDPYGSNATSPWGHIGQVSGCQNNLEVGDPLSGTTFADKVGTFTYHPQELAFFSWFYHQTPSIGVNGWYSDQGSFKTSAAPCT